MCQNIEFSYRLPIFMNYEAVISNEAWNLDSDSFLLHDQYVIDMELYDIILRSFPVKTVLCYMKIRLLLYKHDALFSRL